MVDAEVKNNGPNTSATVIRTVNEKVPAMTKKTVLADVQNESRPVPESVKVCGTKRLTPECPSGHPFPPTLHKPVSKEHLMDTRKKFEFEPLKVGIQNNANKFIGNPQLRHFCNVQKELSRKQTQMREGNTHGVPVISRSHMAPKMTLSYATAPLPGSVGKPGNGMRPVERDYPKVCAEATHVTKSKRDDGRKWEERFVHLQNFLKICDDESTYKAHIQSKFL